MSNIIFQQIHQQINSADNILIVSHQKPDGDACGSTLSMASYIKSLGKNAVVFNVNPAPAYFDFLPGIENVSNDNNILNNKWDLIIVLDSGDLNHTKVDLDVFDSAPIINMDHHFSNHRFGNINCVDDLASSTCEIVYKFLKSINFNIDKNTATCLLCGILNDTSVFSNGATTIDSMNISSHLVSKGARIHKINDKVVKNKSINGLRLWGEVLSRLKNDDEFKIAHTYIKEEEYQKYQINEEELDGLIDFLNIICDANIYALFRINENHTTVSMRTTRDDIDVSRIAQINGGGGHKKAAGFTIDSALGEDDDLLSFLKKGLK